MPLLAALILSVSAYAPAAGGISGGMTMANGGHVPTVAAHARENGYIVAACPSRIPFGTRLRAVGERVPAMLHGVLVVCRDRFAKRYSSGHLDLLMFTGDARADLRAALAFGRVNGVRFEVVE
jgi:hypothetical protein